MLLVDGITLKDGDSVVVVQKGKDGIKLSSTSMFIFAHINNTVGLSD